jgi:3-hydroxybutyryl-CoA dehydratase
MKKEIPPFSNMTMEDIKEGMVATYSQTITDADIKEFAGLSGDKNPVHVDEDYARKSPFKKRIAHGMLTASFFSGLFGTKLPGPGCVYTFQSLRFRKPVYVNDTVVAEIIVREVNHRKRTAKFSTTCKGCDEIVTEGEAEIHIPLYLTKILITKKSDLLEYKAAIMKLFFDCFDKEMNEDLWEWAYKDNPNGDPIVSLYFDGDQLIGHYAVIPMMFELGDGNINGLLSMTTMVQKAYRKYGVFVDQASDVYEEGRRLVYKFVCGFPNKNSAPGFKRRLGWTLD